MLDNNDSNHTDTPKTAEFEILQRPFVYDVVWSVA